MSFNTPKAPAAPDPYATAKAQTASNVETAVANSVIGNANESGPLGGVKYRQIGSMDVGGHSVPRWQRHTYLSPRQKKLQMHQEILGDKMNRTAVRQMKRLDKTLSTPLTTAGLPEEAEAPQLLEMSGKDYSADRLRVEDAMMQRLRPELDRARSSGEARLAAQGIGLGSEAHRAGFDQLARDENDARIGVVLAGGQEQSRLLGEERAGIQLTNQARTGMYGMKQNARERALQERAFLRNQPINEVTALMSGGQMSMPQFSAYNAPEVAPTPVGQYVYNTAGMNQQNWNTRANAAASDRAGLYNIAAAGVGGWMRYR